MESYFAEEKHKTPHLTIVKTEPKVSGEPFLLAHAYLVGALKTECPYIDQPVIKDIERLFLQERYASGQSKIRNALQTNLGALTLQSSQYIGLAPNKQGTKPEHIDSSDYIYLENYSRVEEGRIYHLFGYEARAQEAKILRPRTLKRIEDEFNLLLPQQMPQHIGILIK